jgi:hypothetical protein
MNNLCSLCDNYISNTAKCAHPYVCTPAKCARFWGHKSLAGNPIIPPKHQLLGHKEEDCHISIETSRRRLLRLLLETSQPHKHHTTTWVFCVLCFCQRGGFSFILCELIFGTAVLRPLLLQHAHLTFVQDSPRVADVSRATALTVNQYHSELWKRPVF